MKIISKLMLAVLCANLVLNCFAGCSSSRERIRRENELVQQAAEDQIVIEQAEEQAREAREQEINRLESIRNQEFRNKLVKSVEESKTGFVKKLQKAQVEIDQEIEAIIRVEARFEERVQSEIYQTLKKAQVEIHKKFAVLIRITKRLGEQLGKEFQARIYRGVGTRCIIIYQVGTEHYLKAKIDQEIAALRQKVIALTRLVEKAQAARDQAAKEQEVRDSAIKLAKAQAEEQAQAVKEQEIAQEKARIARIQAEQNREAREQEMKNLSSMSSAAGVPLNFGYKYCNPNEEYYEQDEQYLEQPANESLMTRLESACHVKSNQPNEYPSIKLTDNQLNSLKEQFDNKIMTPSSWGPSKSIRFDYQHILGSKPQGKSKFQMGHTDSHNILYHQKQLLGVKFTGYGPCKSYGYRWSDRGILNTFFPDDWPNNKIISKINQVMNNGMTVIDKTLSSISCHGKTDEGLTIKIIFEAKDGKPTGKIKTAYPII